MNFFNISSNFMLVDLKIALDAGMLLSFMLVDPGQISK